MTRSTLCVFLLSVIPAIACAQMKRDVAPDTALQQVDSAGVRQDSLFHPTKDALTATLLSTALPGAGQIYNEDYWKAPIIWAGIIFFAYAAVIYNDSFVKYQNLYFNSPDSTIRGSQQYFNQKESFRDARDMDGAYLFLIYALNIADAYVSAHLFDFTVSDTKFVREIRLEPYFGAPGTNSFGSPGLQLQVRLR